MTFLERFLDRSLELLRTLCKLIIQKALRSRTNQVISATPTGRGLMITLSPSPSLSRHRSLFRSPSSLISIKVSAHHPRLSRRLSFSTLVDQVLLLRKPATHQCHAESLCQPPIKHHQSPAIHPATQTPRIHNLLTRGLSLWIKVMRKTRMKSCQTLFPCKPPESVAVRRMARGDARAARLRRRLDIISKGSPHPLVICWSKFAIIYDITAESA